MFVRHVKSFVLVDGSGINVVKKTRGLRLQIDDIKITKQWIKTLL